MTSSNDRRDNNDTEGSGKVANDHNRTGHQPATQIHQGKRTPESRHDRESFSGHPQGGRRCHGRKEPPGSFLCSRP
jgi:hypothetical protein